MKHHQPIILAIGLILLLLGILIRISVGRRRFNRRTSFGTEQFRSYGHEKITQAGEGCEGCVGALLILAGAVMTFVGLA